MTLNDTLLLMATCQLLAYAFAGIVICLLIAVVAEILKIEFGESE